MSELVVIGFLVLLVLVPAGFFVAWQLRELRNMDGFAKSLRRMRDETREYGGDFKPIAKLASEMIEPRK